MLLNPKTDMFNKLICVEVATEYLGNVQHTFLILRVILEILITA